MNKYEAFRNGLLKNASLFAGNDHLYFTSSYKLSVEFGIPEPHVREQLVELAEQGLISLTAREGITSRETRLRNIHQPLPGVWRLGRRTDSKKSFDNFEKQWARSLRNH